MCPRNSESVEQRAPATTCRTRAGRPPNQPLEYVEDHKVRLRNNHQQRDVRPCELPKLELVVAFAEREDKKNKAYGACRRVSVVRTAR